MRMCVSVCVLIYFVLFIDLTDHSLCPPISHEDLTTTGTSSDGSSVSIIGSSGSSTGTDVIHSGTQIEVKPPELCTVSGLQVSNIIENTFMWNLYSSSFLYTNLNKNRQQQKKNRNMRKIPLDSLNG